MIVNFKEKLFVKKSIMLVDTRYVPQSYGLYIKYVQFKSNNDKKSRCEEQESTQVVYTVQSNLRL